MVLVEVADGVVRQSVGVVVGLGLVFGIVDRGDVLVLPAEGRGVVEAAGAGDGPVELVEAPLDGPVRLVAARGDLRGDVPLAAHVGAVAGDAEDFGEGDRFAVERAAVAVVSAVVGHVADARLVGVEPREEGGAGRAAAGGVVELAEADAAGGEGVGGGGLDLAAVAADVRVAHVVAQDDDDVGAAGQVGGDGEGGRR